MSAVPHGSASDLNRTPGKRFVSIDQKTMSVAIHPQDLLSFLRARRSLRRYQARPIPEGLLEQLLEAGDLGAVGA